MINNNNINLCDLKDSYIFYNISLNYLEIVAKELANTFTCIGNAWARMSEEEVKCVLITALKLYFFKTHFHVLSVEGRETPTQDELAAISAELRVPRFIRDIIRELCRPMASNSTLYLPDIRYTRAPATIPLFGIFGPIPLLGRWNLAMRDIGYELVALDAEAPKPSPLSFFREESTEVFAVSQLESWRLAAVGRLRHLLHTRPYEVKDADAMPADHTPIEVYNDAIRGRIVGHQNCFVYNMLHQRRLFGYYPTGYRFPSEEEHSMTPPRSERTQDSLEPRTKVKRIKTVKTVEVAKK